MQAVNPVDQAHSSISRLSNLLFTILALGLLIGILSSSLVAVLQTYTAWIIALIAVSLLLTGLMLIRFINQELSLRSLERVLPTAIVFDPVADDIVIPVKLRMAPREIFPPFPVQTKQTHLIVRKHGDLSSTTNIWNLEAIFTLLTALSAKLSMFDDFAPMIANVNRGPFLSSKQYINREHVIKKIDECTPSLLDTGIVRRLFPTLSFNLPKGVSLRLHLSQLSFSLVISSIGVSLSLRPAGGVGAPTRLSPWNRVFPKKQNDCQIMGLLFTETLSFGGLSLLGLHKKVGLAYWSFKDILYWYYGVYEWFGTYLDWIDSEDEIPIDELFQLISESPPHYRYAKGAVPPGNGDIVFEMEK